MKIRIAYIEEPPFYWTGEDDRATGADIELAEVVLRAMGVSAIEHCATSFAELLPGVQQGRWDMNVPIFMTADRARDVAFSAPVWTLGDGFLVRAGNPKSLTSYEAAAADAGARLGVIPAQVQTVAAKAAGVRDAQMVSFDHQPDAIAALLAGRIDAFAATALGNRVTAKANPALEAVAHVASGASPVGAFSFAKGNADLLRAVDAQLARYLGSADHRARMARYGFTATEIDGVVVGARADSEDSR